MKRVNAKFAPCVPGTSTCSICGRETSTVNVGGEHFCHECLCEAEVVAGEAAICPVCGEDIAAGDRAYALNGMFVCADCVDDAIEKAADAEIKGRNDAVEAIGRRLDSGADISASNMQFFYNCINF